MSRRSRRARTTPKVAGVPLLLVQLITGALLAILLGIWLGKFYISRVLDARTPQETAVEGEQGEGDHEGQVFPPPLEGPDDIDPTPAGENPSEEVPPGPVPMLTDSIAPLQVYRVQVAAFGQEENAQALLAELAELGFRGTISASGDVYRVSIGLFSSRGGAEVFIGNLTTLAGVLAEEPLIVAESLAQATVTYLPKEKDSYGKIVQALEKARDLSAEMESLWLLYVSSGQGTIQLGGELERIAGEIKALKTALSEAPAPATSQLWEEVNLLPGDLEATLAELQKVVTGGGQWTPYSQALARLIRLWPSLS